VDGEGGATCTSVPGLLRSHNGGACCSRANERANPVDDT